MQPIPANFQASGNKECVALMERWLEYAQQGKVRYIGIVGCENPGHANMEYAGSSGCEFAANWGYDLLKRALMRPSELNSSDGEHLGANYACYDLRRAPISYDFSCWLIAQEMKRIRMGDPPPLRIAFLAPLKDRVMTPKDDIMLENVLVPMVSMVGGVIDPKAGGSQERMNFYCPRPVVEAARNGEEVPRLKPRPEAMERAQKIINGRPPVTITLREAAHDSTRNSNMEAWLRFAAELQEEGERVIILRDTAFSDEPLPGFETCPAASRELHLRGALYEQAKCNLFVSNGPFGLALFGTAPWLYINDISEYPGTVNGAEMWREYIGVEPGDQYPWASPVQRIVWKNDEYENIRAAWDEYAPLLEQAKAA
jgi:hypothetical protein